MTTNASAADEEEQLREKWNLSLTKLNLESFNGDHVNFDDFDFKAMNWLSRLPGDAVGSLEAVKS